MCQILHPLKGFRFWKSESNDEITSRTTLRYAKRLRRCHNSLGIIHPNSCCSQSILLEGIPLRGNNKPILFNRGMSISISIWIWISSGRIRFVVLSVRDSTPSSCRAAGCCRGTYWKSHSNESWSDAVRQPRRQEQMVAAIWRRLLQGSVIRKYE